MMAGNGKIGKQIVLPLIDVKSFGLPLTGAITPALSGLTGKAHDSRDSSSPSDSSGGGGGGGGDKSAAPVSLRMVSPVVFASVSILAFLVSFGLF